MIDRRNSDMSARFEPLGGSLLTVAAILIAARFAAELIGLGPPLGAWLDTIALVAASVGTLLAARPGVPPADDRPTRLGLLAAGGGVLLLLLGGLVAALFPSGHIGHWAGVGLGFVAMTPIVYGIGVAALRLLARRRMRRLGALIAGLALVAVATATRLTSIAGLPAMLVVALVALAMPTHWRLSRAGSLAPTPPGRLGV